jgi:3-oxoadipate enol-lactonase
VSYVERQGARIYYEVTAPAGGAEHTVVLGHSLLCDGRMWDEVVPVLARTYRVINVDARGHRSSSATGAFTIEDLAADWLAVMDKERVDKAALAGLSLGGMTAMRVALSHPARVASLGLLDTSADPEPEPGRTKYRAMAAVTRRFGHIDAFYQTVRKVLFGRTTLLTNPGLVEAEVARIKEKDPRQLYFAVRAVTDRGSIRGQLPAIRCPVLVLVGSEDTATPRVRSERIASVIPQARLVSVPNAGHLSALEQPAQVAQHLVEHLKRSEWS